MENKIEIFENEKFGAVRTTVKDFNEFEGVVYVLECGDLLKIGSSKQPDKRLSALIHQFKDYGDTPIGRFAMTTKHTNYVENEHKVHELLDDFRKDSTELFSVSFEEALEIIRNSKLEFKDETKKKKDESKKFSELMKGFVTGNTELISDLISLNDFAKQLSNMGNITVQPADVRTWLCQQGYVSGWLETFGEPTDLAKEFGLLKMTETTEGGSDEENGIRVVTKTLYITGKGQTYFVNKFLNESVEY